MNTGLYDQKAHFNLMIYFKLIIIPCPRVYNTHQLSQWSIWPIFDDLKHGRKSHFRKIFDDPMKNRKKNIKKNKLI